MTESFCPPIIKKWIMGGVEQRKAIGKYLWFFCRKTQAFDTIAFACFTKVQLWLWHFSNYENYSKLRSLSGNFSEPNTTTKKNVKSISYMYPTWYNLTNNFCVLWEKLPKGCSIWHAIIWKCSFKFHSHFHLYIFFYETKMK